MSTPDSTRRKSPRRTGNLAVEVTARCNRRCTYCYNGWRVPDAASVPLDLPAADLVALVDRVLGESGLDGVQLTGGEPLLRDDFGAVVEGLARPGRRLSLVTDGGLLDDPTVALLARLGVGPVQPTLLAADRGIHDALKGAECFDATVEGLARLVAARVPVSVSFVCTKVNHACFRDVVDLCFALGVRTVAFSRFCTAGNGLHHVEALQPEPAQVTACLDVAEEAVARRGMVVHVAISLPPCILDPARYPHLRFGRCAVSSGRPGYTMDPQGRLRACSVSPVVLGDLRTESWGEVMERARDTYLASMARIPASCRSCEARDQCGGGCRESAIAAFSDPDRADPLAWVE
jgi:pyrroloquinoline quinone biosynthesis protein E